MVLTVIRIRKSKLCAPLKLVSNRLFCRNNSKFILFLAKVRSRKKGKSFPLKFENTD